MAPGTGERRLSLQRTLSLVRLESFRHRQAPYDASANPHTGRSKRRVIQTKRYPNEELTAGGERGLRAYRSRPRSRLRRDHDCAAIMTVPRSRRPSVVGALAPSSDDHVEEAESRLARREKEDGDVLEPVVDVIFAGRQEALGAIDGGAQFALAGLAGHCLPKLFGHRSHGFLGRVSLPCGARKAVAAHIAREPPNQLARMIEPQEHDRHDSPNGSDDEGCAPRRQGRGKALHRGPAECDERQEQREHDREASSEFDPEPAELRAPLRRGQLHVAPHEEGKLFGELTETFARRGLRHRGVARCASAPRSEGGGAVSMTLFTAPLAASMVAVVAGSHSHDTVTRTTLRESPWRSQRPRAAELCGSRGESLGAGRATCRAAWARGTGLPDDSPGDGRASGRDDPDDVSRDPRAVRVGLLVASAVPTVLRDHRVTRVRTRATAAAADAARLYAAEPSFPSILEGSCSIRSGRQGSSSMRN